MNDVVLGTGLLLQLQKHVSQELIAPCQLLQAHGIADARRGMGWIRQPC